MKILSVNGVGLSYDREVLKGVELVVKKGEIISVVGRSGAGKTSLLKIIAGTLDPTEGEVLFNGKKVEGPSVSLIPGHPEISLVNQDFKLDEYHTVEENIYGQILYLPRAERDKFTEELIALMELDEVRKQKAHTLSGGEQQRLALARVLASEPEMILLDEPFSHLDGGLRKKLIHYLLELRRVRNTTVLLVSHDGSETLGLSDRIVLMKKGRIVRVGNPLSFYYKPKSLEDGRIFGVMNSVRIGSERFHFRPDEYSIEKSVDEVMLELRFLYSSFTGPMYENYFEHKNGESVMLLSWEPLNSVDRAYVRRKG
ncbi:MAG: ATP-binding cassette domain-containing protein [Bacteroidetes bacterium]|nr:MAG: ATP-binding cassette domain-containing protein [Bacteroidota bacterium]